MCLGGGGAFRELESVPSTAYSYIALVCRSRKRIVDDRSKGKDEREGKTCLERDTTLLSTEKRAASHLINL